MKKQILLSLLVVAFLHHQTIAQISYGGQPYSFINYLPEITSNSTIELAKPDLERLRAQDVVTDQYKDIPLRFGFKHEVDLGINNAGEWTNLQNGDRIWRLAVKCPEAKSINFAFDNFYLPEGSTLYIYNQEHTNQLGAYNSKSNKATGKFGVGLLLADNMVIEYYEPAAQLNQGILHINYITHGYRNVFKDENDITKGPFGNSGDCENNVICPIGDPWADQIRSVALIVIEGNSWCSGAMVNNTALDGKPYFLTANHCTEGFDVTDWVYYFNHQSTTCSGNTGPVNQSVSGSSMIASRADSDFALLLLEETPPASFNVFLSGWDKSDDLTVTGTVGIHHPAGDVKKISINEDAPTHEGPEWYIANWEDGVTEGGSSGSPLYDQNKRIIGQLFGGLSGCDGDLGNGEYDVYGRLGVSWNGSSAAKRLKDWLDPNNSNVSDLDGVDVNVVGLNKNKIEIEVSIYPNPSNGKINVDFGNLILDKNSTINILNSLGQVAMILNVSNPSKTLAIDCTNLKNGIYSLQFKSQKINFVKKLILEK